MYELRLTLKLGLGRDADLTTKPLNPKLAGYLLQLTVGCDLPDHNPKLLLYAALK